MQKARRRPQASTACRHTVSGSFSLPCSGFFSPFPHGTSSLSVSQEYLALPDGSGGFRQDFTCPALLRILINHNSISCTGLSPFIARSSNLFHYQVNLRIQSYNPSLAETKLVWAISTSLAATTEITIVFSSFAYLDVSVQQVCVFRRHNFIMTGFPIRICLDHKIFAPPQTFSQLITSFIAFESLGIPRVPLVTYQFYYNSTLLITTSINSNMSKNFIVSKHESNHVKTKVIYIYDNHPIVIE